METLTRHYLAGLPRRRLHEGRNVTKAVVEVAEIEGRAIVLKDLVSRPWPVRLFLGPWQLDRETRAYARLRGVPGVPAFLGRIDRQAIALEFIPGRSLAACRSGEIPPAFFDQLDRVVESVHARGVAHGDLHRHDVLVGTDGRPRLVDFSTSLVADSGSTRARRFVFEQMRRADLRSAARLRRRLVPERTLAIPPRPGLYRLGAPLRRLLDLVRGGSGH
ncbi:MAG TPA: hypothetical protein VFT43_15715 [Candidatus Polarisedimenticolia bacterium]|nr:hypothetical protein [Candidatus Polarisedimenticolia bacterium]